MGLIAKLENGTPFRAVVGVKNKSFGRHALCHHRAPTKMDTDNLMLQIL